MFHPNSRKDCLRNRWDNSLVIHNFGRVAIGQKSTRSSCNFDVVLPAIRILKRKPKD